MYDPTLSLKDIENEIKKAYRHRKRIKSIAESLSLEYRTRLAQAKKEAGEGKAATYIHQLNSIESKSFLSFCC